ncbi:MAG: glutamate--tRNA ligase [Actinobacteria bacterium]|nr:glutamate--tRNA ligase [Actinomycetota bacterium]MDA3016514.1 glutamate--tRNA ligase [Actinomycetota bacterium]
MAQTPRYRFAPSPTGYFHVGGARTALYNWILALQNNGVFVLRIEDTDDSRNNPQWTKGILEALAWLGIDSSDSHFEGPLFQSANAALHVAAAEKLFEQGKAYYCDLSTEDIQKRAKESGKQGYDGYSRDRGLGPGEGRVLRFRVPQSLTIVQDEVRGSVEFDNSTIEDFVLLRGNGSPVFLLANVVDDITQGITHVVRAEEHLPNAPKQQMIWQALGVTPPSWAHVPVLVNEQRKKLSKRRDKVAVEQYREEGVIAAAMKNYLMTLGWAPTGDTEIVPFEKITADFKLGSVNHSPAFFDIVKLQSFNADYIRAMTVDEFIRACEPWLVGAKAPWQASDYDAKVFAEVAPLVQTRVQLLQDVPSMVDFLFCDLPTIDDAAFTKAFAPEWASSTLIEIREGFTTCEFTPDALKAVVEAVGEKHSLKLGKLQAPLRVAVTGRSVGPPLFEPIALLGRDATLKRIDVAIAKKV